MSMRWKRLTVFCIMFVVWHYVLASAQKTSVGFTPLNEFGAALYKGYPGGLYPAGSNDPPASHRAAGLSMAGQIQPLDQTGAVDAVNGKIVFLSVGMSNTTQEFSMFKSIADADPVKNPNVIIVDGAQGGQTAAVISNPQAQFWTIIDQRLASAKVTAQQVQAAWLKEADSGPTQAFPIHAQTLQSEMEKIVGILKIRYPKIRIVFISSRIYGGYATTTLNPEPYAYESGFTVKWLIEKQISGDAALAFTGTEAKAPWLAWGPYLWADGLNARSDGLKWEIADFQSDGTHPSSSGQKKVAQLLLNFLKTEPTARCWFLKKQATGVKQGALDLPVQFSLEQNYPNPFNPVTTIRYALPGSQKVSLKVFDSLGRETAGLTEGEKSPGWHTVIFDASNLASGVYFYRLSTSLFTCTRMMAVIK